MTRAVYLVVALVLPATASSQETADDRRPGQVTIYRDDFGVPHIYAANEADAFYGLGYAQAEDQLDYVLQLYLVVRGEQAAAYGDSLVEADFQARQWMHTEESRAGFDRLSPPLQDNYRHYVAGLERFMRDHPDEVPDWAPDPEPWDPIAVSRGLLWNSYMAGDGLRDCQRGGVRLGAALEADLRERSRAASNEWVLAPWRTADGATIVLSDPHGGIDGSFVYESRIDAGDLKSAGYSMGPALLLAHTRYASWGMTTGAPDVADCYEVEVDADDPRRYPYDGRWMNMETREITIAVKDGPAVTRTLEYTRHNEVLSPVVARANGKAYVVSTPYMHDAGGFDQEVYEINLARNVGEVQRAMGRLGMFAQNLMFGDRDGNSLYVRAGRTPRRPEGFDWSRPVPGNSSESAWDGLHPVDELVVIETPPQGYMQNNNISPDVMMEESPATPDRYPDYIFNDRPGRNNSRGVRAVEVLSRAVHFTVDDAIELALDERWVEFDAWQRALGDALGHHVDRVARKTPLFREVAHRILHFDGDARAESVDALNYYYWRDALISGMSDDEVRRLVRVLWEDEPLTSRLAGTLIESVDRAIETMIREHGTPRLAYGEVFRIGRDERTWPLGGGAIIARDRSRCAMHPLLCTATLRAFQFGPADSLGQRRVLTGSRLLRLAILTDPVQSFTLHNFGQSARPDSPHYVDQARLTSRRRLKRVYFEHRDLMGHVTSTTVLEVDAGR